MSAWKGIRFFIGQLPSFSALGYHARKLKWRKLEPDFSGQTWVVTGASKGIGAAIARNAALAGARVVAVARSQDELEALRDDVVATLAGRGDSRREHTGEILPAESDLSDLTAITNLCETLTAKIKIDVLINNVGILNNEYRESPQGFELSYAVNLLGQYYLTERLLNSDTVNRGGLVIAMASGGLYNVARNTSLLNQPSEGFDGLMAYAAHKRAHIALTDRWRRMHRTREVFAYTMHPGWVRTAGVETSLPAFNKILKPILRTAQEAGDTALWLAQKRPATRDDTVWFDRKARTAYLFGDTKQAEVTVEELIDYLEADLREAGVQAS